MKGKSKQKIKSIWQKANGSCAHCGKETMGHDRTIDHFVPASLGGTIDEMNLMPLCKSCNIKRGNKIVDPDEYYKYANKWAINECKHYLSIFRKRTTNMLGEKII